MSKPLIVMLIILAVLIVALVVLYFLGRRLQRKQNAQQEQMEASKQTMSLLIIDKKRMKLNEAGLPQAVIDQTPKLLRRSKLPILKVRVGNRVMSLICDEKIFDNVWEDSFVSEGTLNVHLRHLREKIEEDPNSPTIIKTVRGMGLILNYNSENNK